MRPTDAVFSYLFHASLCVCLCVCDPSRNNLWTAICCGHLVPARGHYRLPPRSPTGWPSREDRSLLTFRRCASPHSRSTQWLSNAMAFWPTKRQCTAQCRSTTNPTLDASCLHATTTCMHAMTTWMRLCTARSPLHLRLRRRRVPPRLLARAR